MNAHAQSCQLKDCNKKFLKSVGAYVHGTWFCCDEHADADPSTAEMGKMIENA